MKKVLLAFLCIVLAGALGFAIVQSKRENQARTLELEEISKELTSLREQKLELETELAGVRKESDEQLSGMATFSLLVTDLSDKFVKQIAPLLEEAELPAVMALSPEQFPGRRGLIKLEDFEQRLESGWDYCLAWSGGEDFDGWYTGMVSQLETIGLSAPTVLYCAERSYTAELETAASANGITTIVHSGEKNLPLVATEFEELWKPGSIRWIASGARNTLESAVEKHGSMAFVVDQVDFFESEFTVMLELVKRRRAEETLMTGTFAAAIEYRKELIALQEQMQNDAYEAKVSELKEKIEAVDLEIRSLLNKN